MSLLISGTKSECAKTNIIKLRHENDNICQNYEKHADQ